MKRTNKTHIGNHAQRYEFNEERCYIPLKVFEIGFVFIREQEKKKVVSFLFAGVNVFCLCF